MSIILCRQPSMDSSHVLEATTMRLKLVLPKPVDYYFKPEINSYLYNQKSLKLGQKSLELCTESLGSETGSEMSDNDTIFSVPTSVTKSRRDRMESKKVLPRSLPPPLMTMSGSKLFQVRPHREGGRLVIEATETNLGNACLRAERSDGRLRLTCWKNVQGDLDMGSHENDMKESEKSEDEIEKNVLIETHRRLRRCNEDHEYGDKGICCNWEPCCWVATS
ncbi:putative The fantastic four family protein [Helianthus annuus]|nr:putative The fantastic four family protein [Helianthus annuus]KAJ0541739.1 putative The fantastic four family protein [Helianthus annuus]KAJ0706814.1 putative The fantastic four family protein [Helianthus annuus]KAJ0710844.1 putative The fantastic four family protein [Helianthus annuus]KAJ0887419.1 putative The fantastic four family protein [Helianthus annuus]